MENKIELKEYILNFYTTYPTMTEAKLQLNGEDVPLNPIMVKIITNITLGFVKALKGIPEEIKELDLNIKIE